MPKLLSRRRRRRSCSRTNYYRSAPPSLFTPAARTYHPVIYPRVHRKTAPMEPAERTLLVLYAPSPPLLLTPIRQRLVAAGLDIVLTEMLDREELEEAGIELDAEGEEEGGEQRTGGESGEGQDCAVVLSGVGAVQVLKELVGMRGARQDS